MSRNVSPNARTNRLREKDCWHSYGLQMLGPEKFLQVAGRIIEGRYVLLTVRRSAGGLEEVGRNPWSKGLPKAGFDIL